MKRIEMEHIGYVPHVPQPGPHPGTLPFVQIDAERCVGCDTARSTAPRGPSLARWGGSTPSRIPKPASTAASA